MIGVYWYNIDSYCKFLFAFTLYRAQTWVLISRSKNVLTKMAVTQIAMESQAWQKTNECNISEVEGSRDHFRNLHTQIGPCWACGIANIWNRFQSDFKRHPMASLLEKENRGGTQMIWTDGLTTFHSSETNLCSELSVIKCKT